MSLAFDVLGTALDRFGSAAMNGKSSGGGEQAASSAIGTASAAAACYHAVFSAGSEDTHLRYVNHADAYEAAEFLVWHAIAMHQLAGVHLYLNILEEMEDGKALAQEYRAVMHSKSK